MAARCAWIDEGEGAGGLLVMRVLLAMLPQLRGVETEVRFHAPEAVRVSSKAASLAPTSSMCNHQWRSVACRTGALGSLYYCQIGGQRCSDRGLLAGQLLLFDTGFPHSVPHDH